MELLEIRKEIINGLKQDLPELVDKFNHFILKILPSKQNSVVLLTFNKETDNLPRECVIKVFRTENADTEFETLVRLKKQKLLVPRILYYKKPYLLLEKVEGINTCDLINNKLKNIESFEKLDKQSKQEITLCIINLADWMAKLHRSNIVATNNNSEVIVLNKGDTRLRDFIFNPKNDALYGMDFEDSFEGNHLIDISWICCSLLDTNPGIFELKLNL